MRALVGMMRNNINNVEYLIACYECQYEILINISHVIYLSVSHIDIPIE